MLAIIICYHSFFEFLEIQLKNIETYVKVPYCVYVIDNSDEGDLIQSSFSYPNCKILRNQDIYDSPSGRHQSSVNLGLRIAWTNDMNSEFLILDNDMIFLTEWNPPRADLVYEPSKRGQWEYCWMNLLYMKRFQSTPFRFEFVNCPLTNERTDSGGSSGHLLRNANLDKRTVRYISDTLERLQYLPGYQLPFKELCQEYNLPWWFDVYSFNGTKIFHFRAMSNYTKYPQDFMDKKKKLILKSMTQ